MSVEGRCICLTLWLAHFRVFSSGLSNWPWKFTWTTSDSACLGVPGRRELSLLCALPLVFSFARSLPSAPLTPSPFGGGPFPLWKGFFSFPVLFPPREGSCLTRAHLLWEDGGCQLLFGLRSTHTHSVKHFSLRVCEWYCLFCLSVLFHLLHIFQDFSYFPVC